MAAPSLVQAGTGQLWQSGAAVSVSLAGVTVGNVIIGHALIDGTPVTGSSMHTPVNMNDLAGSSGATVVAFKSISSPSPDVGSPAAALQTIFIARATASNPSWSVSTSGGEDVYCRMYEFTGVNTGSTLADVIENGSAGVYTNGAGTSATIADSGVTTLGADRLAVNFIGVNDDNQADFDTEAFTGQTGGTWVSGGSYGSATGTDGAIGLQYATMASAGTIDGGTITMAASDAWGVIGFALIPAATATSLLWNPNLNTNMMR